VRPDRCELWVPTQAAAQARTLAASLTGLPASAVTVHPTLVGGGFGRRAQLDYVVEAVLTAREFAGPVQLLFTRTDDLQHGGYHPATWQRLGGALDAHGAPVALVHRVVGAARGEAVVWGGLKSDLPYAIEHQRLSAVDVEGPLRPAPWRSVSRFHVTFARESFLDEIAAKGGRDPLELRLSLLERAPRLQAVLRAAAQGIGWGSPGWRGIAVDEEFGTVAAVATEVTRDARGALRPSRVVCAVECGTVVDPRGLEAQIEGGVIFGLSAALHGEITVAAGRVEQSNYDDYPICRIDEAPRVEVRVLPSSAPPTGAGEIAVAPMAPSLAGALFAATGKRLRDLPLRW
jgi:isoquinoline 1-oxidoreductase beta subunit